MKIALLGLGTVGKAVYQIIMDKTIPFLDENSMEISYVLVRNINNRILPAGQLVTDFDIILNDKSVEVIIEMMGANVSYNYIKRALLASKHVITANKEVIAEHYVELQQIAINNHVNLLFEASVGGGIPIVHSLLTASEYNHVTSIEGILNGTTNFILTAMHQDKIQFIEALKIVQDRGFAEADPTADLEGLDMVRKIAILSMICYRCPISLQYVYHSGISHISKDIIEVIDLLDYKLKFIASSKKEKEGIALCVEPVVFKKSDLLANVDYEYNLIRYEGDYCGTQLMYGKGAGNVTANAILFDLELLSSGFQQRFLPKQEAHYLSEKQIKARYLIKNNQDVPKKWIEKKLGTMIITKLITKDNLHKIINKNDFYARIG